MKKALAILLAFNLSGLSAFADQSRVSDSIRETAMKRKAEVDKLETELYITAVQLDELNKELDAAKEKALDTENGKIIIAAASVIAVLFAVRGLKSAITEFRNAKKYTTIVSNRVGIKVAKGDRLSGVAYFGAWLVPAYVSYVSGKAIISLTNAEVQQIKSDISDAQDEIESIKLQLAKLKV